MEETREVDGFYGSYDSANCARLVLPMYVWFQVLEDGWMLLWEPRSEPDIQGPIEIQLINLDRLQQLSDLDSWLFQTPELTRPIFSIGEEFQSSIEFDAALSPGKHALDVHPSFRRIQEICVIADNPLIPAAGIPVSCCIYVVKPDQSTVEVLPQDWFNKGDMDFGYQWVTRVAREPTTGRLVGDGIRIDSFVLDEAGRNLAVR